MSSYINAGARGLRKTNTLNKWLEIPLTKGKVAIIDAEDYGKVGQYNWRCQGGKYYSNYAISRGSSKILMHRLVIDAPEGVCVDHINGNGLDNRKANLRLASTSQNGMNRGKQKNNSSGYKGVSWHKGNQKWRATIRQNNHQYTIGYFNDKNEAAKAYNRKALELFGDYAKLNEIRREEISISSLTSKKGAKKLRKQVIDERENKRGRELVEAIYDHFERIHSFELPTDLEIERMILEDNMKALSVNRNLKFESGIVTFSPSSASKCGLELFYKFAKVGKDADTLFPYQRRVARNGSAVHAAIQRDLLYAEKYLIRPAFTVLRTKAGRPAWEKNIQHVKQFEHQGVKFQVDGMMDGILVYTPDESRIGLEFKTKSTTLGAIGNYKLPDAAPYHKEQCIGYNILFDLPEFIIFYESLSKDSWMKGADATPDLKAFYYEVTEADRERMLDKFAYVAECFYNGELPPPDRTKCLLCGYKTRCSGEAVGA